MKVCGDTELAGGQSRGTWFDSKICYKITGQVTALDCKSSLNTNCRIGLAVRGFESLPTHTMQSSPNGMASPFRGEIMRVQFPYSAPDTDVAQLARATDSYSVGHWFEPNHRYKVFEI